MANESDKHSPRIDDAMAGDVESLLRGSPEESRAQEGRLQEDPSVGPGRRAEAEEASGLGIAASTADDRADLARHLAAAAFPARRAELVRAAADDHAEPRLLDALRSLPDEDYATVADVWRAMGGATESSHT